MFVLALDIAKQIAVNFQSPYDRKRLLELIAKLLELDCSTSVQRSSK